jgi:ElaB/YqjD/DUF883 family membrane-anchored ribosome-binding protein
MAADMLTKIKEGAEKVELGALEKAAEAGRSVQQNTETFLETAQPVTDALKASLRDQPLVTLSVFAAVGFVLGAIWR